MTTNTWLLVPLKVYLISCLVIIPVQEVLPVKIGESMSLRMARTGVKQLCLCQSQER